MDNKGYKFYLEASLDPIKETVALRKEVASIIDLPKEDERQPDLSYFSSVFVSTGTNLNNAHFLSSELVMAVDTIVSKAVDVEHEEDKIIGHIYSKAFVDKDHNKKEISELLNKEIATLDKEEYHIVIGSVIYKSRFPEVAQEIAENKWKVSMEAYYKDYSIKVGDLILSKDEAKSLGIKVDSEDIYGKQAKIIKAVEVIAEGPLIRVLHGICFSGVGIVKNPANPPSVVLEATASENILEFNYDDIKSKKEKDNKVTISNIDKKVKEKSNLQYKDTVGICVNYKKELLDSVVKDQDTNVIETNWCSKYDSTCPVSGDFKDKNCLYKQMKSMVKTYAKKELCKMSKAFKIEELTEELLNKLKKVK